MKSFLVVISHYNAWPTDQLLALLDQIKEIPAGHPFECRVVVNRAVDRDLELPERHRDVEILTRENTGFNIGAWELGWRQGPPRDAYLFLQEECRIIKAGWLEAFAQRLDDPKVGLVGESLYWPGFSWDRADAFSDELLQLHGPIHGWVLSLSRGIRAELEKQGIPAGRSAEHLQSLVWSARREVLEASGGFSIGRDYGEAIVAEVAASKRVVALGLKVVEVGFGPFQYILHPQWSYLKASFHRVLFRRIEPLLPVSLTMSLRRAARSARQRITGRKT